MNRPVMNSCFAVALLSFAASLPAQNDSPDGVSPRPQVAGSGIQFNPQLPDQLLINDVTPESFAAAADLRPGDVVVTIDDRVFANADEVETYLTTLEGRTARFLILRDGQEESLVYLAPTTDIETHVVGELDTVPQPRFGQPAGIGLRIAGRNPVTVVGVYAGSPADMAGILPGDQLLAVDGIEYGAVTPIVAAIAQHGVDEDVTLTLRRDAVEQFVVVQPQLWELAFDEQPRVLAGWETRRHRDCYRLDDGFALDGDLFRQGDPELSAELAALRAEVRALHEQLIETNARLEALQIKSLRHPDDVATE
jgi:predicted metalloprotease with PDZ domain